MALLRPMTPHLWPPHSCTRTIKSWSASARRRKANVLSRTEIMVACSHDTGHFTLRLGHLIDLLFTPRLDINEMCSETIFAPAQAMQKHYRVCVNMPRNHAHVNLCQLEVDGVTRSVKPHKNCRFCVRNITHRSKHIQSWYSEPCRPLPRCLAAPPPRFHSVSPPSRPAASPPRERKRERGREGKKER